MSSSTWTRGGPEAGPPSFEKRAQARGGLSAEAGALRGTCWRVVEAQNRVSTLKLVDNLAEQRLLEELIEDSKPPLPPDCRGLHYLLATPFRYPSPMGSRFRRPGAGEGVFYGSEACATAVAEIVFRRLLFFSESPATRWPANPGEYTAFEVAYGSQRGVDLRRPPFDKARATWCSPDDYSGCQAFAQVARAAEIEVIRYESVRDPKGGANLALLTARAFRDSAPRSLQTWRVYLGASGASVVSEFPELGYHFDRDAFSNDPRLAAMRWER